MKPRSKSTSRVLTVLRLLLCVGAIAFLVNSVSWHDHVRLDDEKNTRVRLAEMRDDACLIEQNGEERLVSFEALLQAETDRGLEPIVEYGIRSVVLRLDWSLAAWALIIFGPVWFVQSFRLVLMVGVQGVRLSYWNAIKLTFAGNFFNFALPGTTGGDLVKAYYLSQFTHLKHEVITTVFLDRAVGLLGMILLAAGGIAMAWDPERFGYLVVALAMIFAGLFVGTIFVFSRRARRALGLHALVAALPLGDHIMRIGRATTALRDHKGRVISALVLTVALQSVVIFSAAIMARALGMHGELHYYFIYVAIGFLIGAIPISPPQAIGVLEAAYVQFFTQAGLATASQAVALALGVRLIQLVWSLPGVLVPLLGAHLPSKTELAEIEARLAEESNGANGDAVESTDAAHPVPSQP